jgi:hypothetical protein
MLTISVVLIALTVGALVAIAAPPPGGGSGCEGDAKVEGAGPTTYNAPAGESISSICIKAGRDVFGFACGETDPTGCYDVTWTEGADDCCTSVTIGGGGTSNICKSISHTAATFGGEPCDGCIPTSDKELICDDGIDNDCDGYIDCDDVDCDGNPACDDCVPTSDKELNCKDGIDDDCDGYIDCDDVDCAGVQGCP